jgi:hypothetical protein
MRYSLTAIAVAILCANLWASAPQPTTQDGLPAIMFVVKWTESHKGRKEEKQTVQYVERSGPPRHHVLRFVNLVSWENGHLGDHLGTLSVSRARVVFGDSNAAWFVSPRARVGKPTLTKQWKYTKVQTVVLMPLESGVAGVDTFDEDRAHFLQLTITDFAAADAEFSRIVGEKQPPPESLLINDAFLVKAAAWRDLPEKPTESEDAHRHFVLARHAMEEKNVPRAIDEYELALQTWPMMPDAWFDLGVLYAEVGDYEYAIDSMQRYLALSPNATDAGAARDKIIVWQDKLANHEL